MVPPAEDSALRRAAREWEGSASRGGRGLPLLRRDLPPRGGAGAGHIRAHLPAPAPPRSERGTVGVGVYWVPRLRLYLRRCTFPQSEQHGGLFSTEGSRPDF